MRAFKHVTLCNSLSTAVNFSISHLPHIKTKQILVNILQISARH